MREQKGPIQPVANRRSRATQAYEEIHYTDSAGHVVETQRIPIQQAATHRAGFHSGLHPEDEPYMTQQNQRYANPLDLADQLDYQDEPRRPPTSAVRYRTTQGQEVIRQGNREVVVHQGAPRRRIHWLFPLWIGAIIMLACYLLYSWGSAWWTNHQLDATYGFPRTYQVDEVIGHSDSTDHPTHFIFLNLNGHVLIVELPGGDASHAKIYSGPTLITDNAASVPVTGEFKDVNGDGKIDMIVHIGDQRIIYLNDGTQFKPQQ